MNLKSIIKQTVKILKHEEGWRDYVYDDFSGERLKKGDTIQGTPTAMYGFTRFLNDKISPELYEMFPRWGELGLALLIKKIIDYNLFRFNLYLPYLNEARLVVLTCMIYQMGCESVLGFTDMLQAIEKEDWNEVYREGLNSKWAREDSPERAERMMRIMKRGTIMLS